SGDDARGGALDPCGNESAGSRAAAEQLPDGGSPAHSGQGCGAMRRRRLMAEPSNHDRWLVSYSDFITVLFALFVVLFATSYRDSQAVRTVSHAIHVGFQQLGACQQEHPDGLTVSST